jgi:hypothetical protein
VGQFEAAEAVIAGADIKAARAGAEVFGGGEIGVFQFIGILLHEGEGKLGETGGGGEEESFVIGVFGEDALHQFEAERDGGFDQIGVIVGGKGGTAPGEGIADLIDGEAFDRAAVEQGKEGQSKKPGKQEIVGVR